MVGRPSVTVSLSETDRNRLESWVRRRNTAHGPARRARIVLARAEGATDSGVARSLEVSRMTVAVSRKRFVEHGVDGLLNKSGRGSPHRVTDAQIERAVVTTLEGAPPNATHWTTRSLARAVGLSQSTVVRIWRAFAPRQQRRGTFRLSRDRLLIDKVRDISGLYLNPPDRALALCVDQKPSIRMREPAAPVISVRPGKVEHRARVYCGHRTSDLFTALEFQSGKVIDGTRERERARKFREFLDTIDRSVPADLDIFFVLDTSGIDETPLIRAWLGGQPRCHSEVTPASASWIKVVEGWFTLLTHRHFQRGVLRGTAGLDAAIRHYVETDNANPRPFIWTKMPPPPTSTPVASAREHKGQHTPGSGADKRGWRSGYPRDLRRGRYHPPWWVS